MTRPCELVKDVNTRTRTVYLKKVSEGTFMNFSDPAHCEVCRKARKVFLSDKPHAVVREGDKATKGK